MSKEDPNVGRLVIGRKAGESIHIEGPSVVTILKAKGGRATVMIEADKRTTVLRTEIVKSVAKVQEIARAHWREDPA